VARQVSGLVPECENYGSVRYVSRHLWFVGYEGARSNGDSDGVGLSDDGTSVEREVNKS